jgi:tetratricopeptide (TPR) repeat protein
MHGFHRIAFPLLWGLAILSGGCLSPGLEGARRQYYLGQYDQAARSLSTLAPRERNSILFLMERGMVLQAAGHYEASARDLVEAADRIERFEAYSLSEGAGSLIINNQVYTFKGKPYERTLLHAFTAKDFFALGAWEHAAVESRRIMEALSDEQRGGHPDDAYARYIAGLGLELTGDFTNARLQYQKAADLVSGVEMDPSTGRFSAPGEPLPTDSPQVEGELICFVQVGRAAAPGADGWPAATTIAPVHAELYAGGGYLGRSYTVTDTWRLAALTEEEEAVRSAAKVAARLAFKEAVAEAVGAETREELGHLSRLVLFGLLEQPDLRHWGTLPRWLQIARVPCPREMRSYTAVFRDANGREVGRRRIERPLIRKGSTLISFCRDVDSAR